ncbi:MAG: radical SAM protein [Theionarchaea archaeon]|nr:radical SAM protein [Theionarchaea archaeon]MBU7038119.1 radical SAM protein [Theionarchaea archaeon]
MVFAVKDKYVLLNGLSGAVFFVDKKTGEQLLEGTVTEELKPFFTNLRPEEEAEKAQAFCSFLMKKTALCADSTIAVTYDCNLRCPYCYEVWVKSPQMMNTVIDESTVDKAFTAMEELNAQCSREKPLTLTGGEPLMMKNADIVKYILRKGDDLGYKFTLFTNGVELHSFLPEISSLNIEFVQITLDGPRSVHDGRRISRSGKGTFDIIVRNIEKARDMGITLLLRTNSDPEVLSQIHELALFYRERGWIDDPTVHFAMIHLCDQIPDIENSEKLFSIYRQVLDVALQEDLQFFEASPYVKLASLYTERPRFWPSFWNCAAVTNRYVFDPFGDVYPCRAMLGWKEHRIGVYTPELSFNGNMQKWRDRTIFSMDTCRECELALVCGGGCGYQSLLVNEDLSTPACIDIKQLVTPYLEYMYERRNAHESAQG